MHNAKNITNTTMRNRLKNEKKGNLPDMGDRGVFVRVQRSFQGVSNEGIVRETLFVLKKYTKFLFWRASYSPTILNIEK